MSFRFVSQTRLRAYLRVLIAASTILITTGTIAAAESTPSSVDEFKANLSKSPSSEKVAYVEKRVEFSPEDSLLDGDSILSTKKWTNNEKEIVLNSFAEAATLAPGLFDGVTSLEKLKLFRVSKVESRKFSKVVAAVSDGRILFPDEFFEVDHRTMSVLHELIHVADSGQQISESKEWVEFANPAIWKFRLAQTLLEQPQFSWTNDLPLAKKFRFFKGYAATNLAESLAEYFSHILVNHEAVELNTIESRVLQRLLSPSESSISFSKNFNSASIAFSANQKDLAIQEYKKAEAIDPTAASPHLQLAHIYQKLGKTENTLSEIRKASKLMDDAGVPSYELNACRLLKTEAKLCESCGDLVRARLLFDQIVDSAPGDNALRLYRVKLNELSKRFGSAAADLYSATHKKWDNDCVFEQGEPSADIARRFKEQIKKNAHSDRTLAKLYRRRAAFNTLQGDRATEREEKNRFYRAAIKDLCMELSGDVVLADVFFECAEVSIKLKDVQQATMFRDSLRELDYNSLPAKVVTLLILEFNGFREDSAAMYPALKKLILEKAEPNRRPSEKTDWGPGWDV